MQKLETNEKKLKNIIMNRDQLSQNSTIINSKSQNNMRSSNVLTSINNASLISHKSKNKSIDNSVTRHKALNKRNA